MWSKIDLTVIFCKKKVEKFAICILLTTLAPAKNFNLIASLTIPINGGSLLKK